MTSSIWAGMAAFALAAGVASAATLTTTITATGTGTLGGTPFSNASFTITTTGETGNRVSFAVGSYAIPNTNATINIAGVGTATFGEPTRTFVNQSVQAGGFSRSLNGGLNGNDILYLNDVAAFSTWDLTTNFGPVSDATPVPVNQATGLATSAGTLNFSAYSNATLVAVVPEPAAVLSAAAALPLLRRRRRGNEHAA